jgi:hypothetical protein
VTKNDAKMIGNGKHEVFLVSMTYLSFISGLAKKNTPTEQQSKPKKDFGYKASLIRNRRRLPISRDAWLSFGSTLL